MSSPIGARIKAARSKKRLSQAELSQLCGWSNFPARVSNYESGKREPKSQDLLTLAKVLYVSIDWFYRETHSSELAVYETRPIYAQAKYIPLIEWNAITRYLQYGTYKHSNAKFIAVTHDFSDKSFALRVENDSMQSIDGKGFKQNSIILIVPSVKPDPGDFILATSMGNSITFKQLVADMNKLFLKPLNPRYPITEGRPTLKILGVVRAQATQYK